MLSPRNPQYTAGIFIEQSLTRALSTRRCNEQTVQLLNVGSRVPVHGTAMGLSHLAEMDPLLAARRCWGPRTYAAPAMQMQCADGAKIAGALLSIRAPPFQPLRRWSILVPFATVRGFNPLELNVRYHLLDARSGQSALGPKHDVAASRQSGVEVNSVFLQ